MNGGEIQELREFLEGKFGQIDGRFEQIDQRFDGIDGRLDGMDGLLETVAQGVGDLRIKVDRLLEQDLHRRVTSLERRVDTLEERR